MKDYYSVLRACADYYREHPTVGALLLLWNVEILYHNYVTGRIK